ncbi:MAG: bifunctional riboflavin kinase/FAD synthetase [Bacteroidota bacterium]
MKLARYIEDIPFDKNSVVTVGTFDGVHLAHQKIIGKTVELAKKRNGRSVVVTFEPHPREVLDTASMDMKLLTTLQERQELCEQLGTDWLVVIEFNKAFSQESSRDFYVKYLIGGIGISAIVEGYDHHWGRNREGNIEALVQLGKEYKFDVVHIEQFRHNGIPVNSSMIRNELLNGSVEVGAGFLGRPYTLFGKVVPGDRRGRSLGYPTANVELASHKKIVPKNGIYFVQVRISESRYFGMASIGVRPTFHSDGKRILEVNILDFNQNIYGSDLRIDFLQRLRDEWKFDSVDKLVQQMHHDEELSRELQYKYQSLA